MTTGRINQVAAFPEERAAARTGQGPQKQSCPTRNPPRQFSSSSPVRSWSV